MCLGSKHTKVLLENCKKVRPEDKQIYSFSLLIIQTSVHRRNFFHCPDEGKKGHEADIIHLGRVIPVWNESLKWESKIWNKLATWLFLIKDD